MQARAEVGEAAMLTDECMGAFYRDPSELERAYGARPYRPSMIPPPSASRVLCHAHTEGAPMALKIKWGGSLTFKERLQTHTRQLVLAELEHEGGRRPAGRLLILFIPRAIYHIPGISVHISL